MNCNTFRPTRPGIPLQAVRSVLCLTLLSLATSACVSIGRTTLAQSEGTPLTPTAPTPSASPIVTDRPDFTESAVTVPQGMIQVEAGQTLTQENRQQSLTRIYAIRHLPEANSLVYDLKVGR